MTNVKETLGHGTLLWSWTSLLSYTPSNPLIYNFPFSTFYSNVNRSRDANPLCLFILCADVRGDVFDVIGVFKCDRLHVDIFCFFFIKLGHT